MEKFSSFWGGMPIKDLHLGAQKDRLQVILKLLQGSFFSPGIWAECDIEDTLRRFVTVKDPFLQFRKLA